MKDIAAIKEKIDDILIRAKEINTSAAAVEVLNWLINSVEYFIDNHSKMFKIDLVIDESSFESFPETKKLQDLYREIPDDEMSGDDMDSLSESDKARLEIIGESRSKLDLITANIHSSMKEQNELLKTLFERMSFYYELKGVYKGEFLIDKLAGGVGVLKFEYDSFSVPVTIKIKKVIERPDGSAEEDPNETSVREYVIPDGFSVWIEIAFSSVKKRAAMF